MSILSDFFIADGASVPNYGGGADFDEADKCQLKNLSPLQGGQFLAVLRNTSYDVELLNEFPLVTPEDAEDWTMSVPDDMVRALAALERDQIPSVAAKFAHATREELGWSAEVFVPIVTDLSALAGRAVATKKKMYLW